MIKNGKPTMNAATIFSTYLAAAILLSTPAASASAQDTAEQGPAPVAAGSPQTSKPSRSTAPVRPGAESIEPADVVDPFGSDPQAKPEAVPKTPGPTLSPYNAVPWGANSRSQWTVDRLRRILVLRRLLDL